MKKFIFSVIIVLTLTVSVASAASQFSKKEATVRDDYTIVLNGEVKVLESKVVVIDGVSYLPVREVSTMLDSQVDFGGGIIYINTNEEPQEKVIENIKEKQNQTIEDIVAELEKNKPRDIEKERADLVVEIKVVDSSIAYLQERKALFIKENRQDLADKMEITIQEHIANKERLEHKLSELE